MNYPNPTSIGCIGYLVLIKRHGKGCKLNNIKDFFHALGLLAFFPSKQPSPLSKSNMAEGLVRRQQQLVPSSDRMLKRPRHYDRQEEDVDHIVVEILSWLPVKSLLRSRSVCKSWCTLISDSYVVKKHLSHAGTSNSFRLFLFNLLHTSPKTIDYQGLKGHH